MTRSQVRIAIAGAGISGFATLGYLVQALRTMPSVKVTIYWLQPPRKIKTENLSPPQRDRLTQLKNIGRDPSQLLGGGQVYHPADPSLFTFNGDSAARGFNFAAQRYDTTDYFEWIQANRDLLAVLYPDFAPENHQQRHPHHTLDDIQGTTPRGIYGLYLHDQFLALKAHLPNHITVQTVPEALQSVEHHEQEHYEQEHYEQEHHEQEHYEQTVTVKTRTRQLNVAYLVQATGPRVAPLRAEWAGRVFNAYPCDRYGPNLPPQVTVVGAGAAGIEVALHALHNLQVEQVTLVSHRAQSRLPQVNPTESYQCQWFTRENMQLNPTAKNAQVLLNKELEACYQTCHLPYPGWDTLLKIEDYPSFLVDYLKITNLSPNHPFAHLVRPVMSFYTQVNDLLPAVEQIGVLQLINRVKPLFATQSRACAELMLAALQSEKLKLISGNFLPEQAIPTILLPDSTRTHPGCIILATGFAPSLSPFSAPFYPPSNNTRCYSVVGTSLSAVHNKAASVADAIASRISSRALVTLPSFK